MVHAPAVVGAAGVRRAVRPVRDGRVRDRAVRRLRAGARGLLAAGTAPESSPLAGTGYSEYDAISRSDGGRAGFFGGSEGPGDSGGYGGGSGDSGGYGGGSGGYGSGSGGYEYGRRKRKRNATALIGPMAGAVGLAVLLGVGVYAFAESGGGCSGDDALNLSVAAAPDIAPVVEKAAGRFNDSKEKVDGKCVKATVKKVERRR